VTSTDILLANSNHPYFLIMDWSNKIALLRIPTECILTKRLEFTRGIACRTTVYRPIPSDISVRGCTMSFSESRRAELVPPSPTNRFRQTPKIPITATGASRQLLRVAYSRTCTTSVIRSYITVAPTEI
jgi:hypothetical protein